MVLVDEEQDASNHQVTTESSVIVAPTTVSLDNVIQQCGGLDRFQWLQYFLLNLVQISAGLTAFYYVYAAAEPDHRCPLASSVWPNDNQYNPINSTHESLLNLYIPIKDGKWDQCHLFDSTGMNKTLIECSNKWVFDRSVYGFTFTEAVGLVCTDKPKKSLLATVLQSAGFLALILGVLADRFGRKRTSLVASVLLLTICLITQVAMQWIPMSINAKFGILLVNQFMMGGLTHSISTIGFIMTLELAGAKHRSLVGNMAYLFFTLGEILIVLFAYMTRNWQNLLWANTIFIGISLLCICFTEESPLYLYSKKQYTRLERLLRRMAKTNGRKEINWYPQFQELLNIQLSATVNDKQLTFAQRVRQLVSHRTMIQRILITSLIAFTETLLYYKISYGLAVMKISPYISMLIGAIVEAVGYIIATILMSTRLGRKYTLIIFTGLTSVCILIIPLIVEHSTPATIIISQISKFTISVANLVVWIYIAELFPTSIRSTTNGFAVAVSRFGAIAAPVIDSSIDKQYLPITFYEYAGLAFVVVLLALPLPETRNKPLGDSLHFTNSSDA